MFHLLRVLTVLAMVLAVALPCSAQAGKGAAKDLILTVFEAQKGVDFPPDFQEALVVRLIEELGKIKKFNRVIKPGEPVPENAAGAIKLTGLVTGVDEGSRAARALVGFGAGKSWIKAQVKFLDAASGQVKFEKEIQATFSGAWSASGGDSSKVGANLAKEIAKVAKAQSF